MKAIFLILLFYLLGSVVSWITGGFLPSSIAGMVLLFSALNLKIVKAVDVKPAINFLLDNLMLFFVPVAVGVVGSFMLFRDYLWAIVISSLVSTVVVVGVVGIVAQILIKRREK